MITIVEIFPLSLFFFILEVLSFPCSIFSLRKFYIHTTFYLDHLDSHPTPFFAEIGLTCQPRQSSGVVGLSSSIPLPIGISPSHIEGFLFVRVEPVLAQLQDHPLLPAR